MKKLKRFSNVAGVVIFLFGASLIGVNSIWSQCSGGTSGGALSPAPTTTFQTMTVTAGNYYTFTVASLAQCPTYTFTFCSNGGSTSFDTQITILDNSGTYVGAPGYNDDACGTPSEVVWTPTATGTYRVLINNYFCGSSGATATLAYALSAASTSGNYTIHGDATGSSGALCVDLTANTTGQIGCAWDNAYNPDFALSFIFDFTVNLGNNDGGADGMTFVFQNDPAGLCACGSSGSGFGAQGITNSIILEIDTYLNTEDRDDGAAMAAQGVLCTGGTDPDHIDIWLNGNVNPAAACGSGARVIPDAQPLLNGGVNYNVENGLDHTFRITWTPGAPGTMTAQLMNLAGTITYATVSYSFDPMTVFGTNTPYLGFTAATGGLTNEQVVCSPTVVLPITLTRFNASCEGERVRLDWTTASESNNDRFDIMRSSDGQNYYKIGEVSGQGTSNHSHHYTYMDESPLNGMVYYTLKEVDLNGESEYAGFVRTVECMDNSELLIYPNPINQGGFLTIKHDKMEDMYLEVLDIAGKTVFSSKLLSNEVRIIPELSMGLYVLQLRDTYGGLEKSARLVIK